MNCFLNHFGCRAAPTRFCPPAPLGVEVQEAASLPPGVGDGRALLPVVGPGAVEVPLDPVPVVVVADEVEGVVFPAFLFVFGLDLDRLGLDPKKLNPGEVVQHHHVAGAHLVVLDPDVVVVVP